MFGTYNPADEKMITEVHAAGKDDVDRAVAAARHAFDHGPWRRMSALQRGSILYKYADLVDKHADELAALEALDNGKTFSIAKAADIGLTARVLRNYAGWADKTFGDVVPMEGFL